MTDFFVFDTNNLVSAVLFENSTTAKALDAAFEQGNLVVSNETMNELANVLFRKKFDSYLSDEERWQFIDRIESKSKVIFPNVQITDCRDPKDNKFLELAVTAKASCIVTGDKNLLILHPFRNIPIMNASNFLKQF
ncbi:MAG: putative toxin-antitoxin system toxin component, PIN family [Pricia sp.]